MSNLAICDKVLSVEERREERRLRSWRLAFLFGLGLGGLLASIWVGVLLVNRERELAYAQFRLNASERIDSMRWAIAEYLGDMDAIHTFFFSSQVVERAEFHAFVQPLMSKHAATVYWAWAPQVPVSDQNAFEQTVRATGLPEYRIQNDGKKTPPEAAAVCFPILYAEPSEAAASLLGHNIATMECYRAAVYRTLVSGRQVAFVSPSSQAQGHKNYILYVLSPIAVEKNALPGLKGILIGAFNIDTMLETTINRTIPVGINTYLLDPTKQSPEDKIFQHQARFYTEFSSDPKEKQDNEDGIHVTDTLDIAGARFIIDCIPTKSYMERHWTWWPIATSIIGVIITILLIGYLSILTERTQHIEHLVAERAAELRSMSNAVMDAVVQMDVRGNISHWNPAAERLFGYAREEILGRPVHDTLLPERYRESAKAGLQEFCRTGRGDVVGKVLEVGAQRKDGTEVSVEISISPVHLDNGWGAVAIIRDVTTRRLAEQALRREQRLLREMLDLHERDRKLVAYEIHDGLAQQLTAAVFRFQAVDATNASMPPEMQENFNEGLALLREGVAEARRLISGLRPPVLDELGVIAAVECLVSGQQQNTGIAIEFVHDPAIDRLAPPLESSVFRIVQECLTNACRYSRSPKIRVELSEIEGRVHILIQDWGVGFDPEQVSGGHYGLRGIAERARLLGGDAIIASAPGQGTRITVDLPLIMPVDDTSA